MEITEPSLDFGHGDDFGDGDGSGGGGFVTCPLPFINAVSKLTVSDASTPMAVGWSVKESLRWIMKTRTAQPTVGTST
jgi:hypothetical protein